MYKYIHEFQHGTCMVDALSKSSSVKNADYNLALKTKVKKSYITKLDNSDKN